MPDVQTNPISSTSLLSLWTDQKHLVYECFYFAMESANDESEKSAFQKLQSLYKTLKKECSSDLNDVQRLELLNTYFFKTLDLHLIHSLQPNSPLLLHHVLQGNSGATDLLKLLYVSLADSIGLTMKFISHPSKHLLKVSLEGRSNILNFSEKGQLLQPFELVECVNEGVDFTAFDRGEKTLISYFHAVKNIAKAKGSIPQILLANRYLMRWQPFNLSHIRERAQIAYKTGDYRQAAEDIRSYFVYKSPEIKSLHRLYELSLGKRK